MEGTKIVFAQGDRKKNPTPVLVRPMTVAEVLALKYGDHPDYILNSGRLGTVKITGEIKIKKTDPDHPEVPIKYGLYEYARLPLAEALTRLVVRVYP